MLILTKTNTPVQIRESGKQYATSLYVGSAVDDLPLRSIEFRVLARIARRGECIESASSMGNAFRVSDRTIRRATRFLAAAGLIIEVERVGQKTVRKLASGDNWKPPNCFEAIRKSLTKSSEKARTPDTTATPDTRDAKPLTPETRPPDTRDSYKEFPKGVPLKVREARARADEIESEQLKIHKKYYADFTGTLSTHQKALLTRMTNLKDCESALAHAAGNGIKATSISKIVNEVFANREWEANQHGKNQRGNGSAPKPGKYSHLDS